MISTGAPARYSFAPRPTACTDADTARRWVAIVAYLRDGRPKSSCRRLFVRTPAPHVGFASGSAITMIAKVALDRAGIEGCAHRGGHIFRHSAAMELLQAGVDCSVIALWLGHESVETTQTYLQAHLALKEAALTKLKPYERGKRTRLRPNDRPLAFP